MTTDLRLEDDKVSVVGGDLEIEGGIIGKDAKGEFLNVKRSDVNADHVFIALKSQVESRLYLNCLGGSKVELSADEDSAVLKFVSNGRNAGSFSDKSLYTPTVRSDEAFINKLTASTAQVGFLPLPNEEDTGSAGNFVALNATGDKTVVLDGESGTLYSEAGTVMFQTGIGNPPKPVISHSPAHKNWGLWYRDTDDSFIFQRSDAPVLTVGLGKQNVGIGTDAPQHKLHVEGNVAGQGQFISLSDLTCKTNIEPIASALELIESLRGVSFNWKTDDELASAEQDRNFGFIAQEVEDVMPEVVSEFRNDQKGIAYGEIVPVLVEAVKDLSKKVAQLQSQLDSYR